MFLLSLSSNQIPNHEVWINVNLKKKFQRKKKLQRRLCDCKSETSDQSYSCAHFSTITNENSGNFYKFLKVKQMSMKSLG